MLMLQQAGPKPSAGPSPSPNPSTRSSSVTTTRNLLCASRAHTPLARLPISSRPPPREFRFAPSPRRRGGRKGAAAGAGGCARVLGGSPSLAVRRVRGSPRQRRWSGWVRQRGVAAAAGVDAAARHQAAPPRRRIRLSRGTHRSLALAPSRCSLPTLRESFPHFPALSQPLSA